MSRIIKCDRCGGEVNPKKIGYVLHNGPGYHSLGVGIKHYVTPNHGSEERRLMLIQRYRESKSRERKAREARDGIESCRQKGRAERFRHLLIMEYGEDIDE